MNVLIAGASGQVGSKLLPLLLSDQKIDKVYALVRTPLKEENHKLEQIKIDFDKLPELELPKADTAFCCLGTTIKKAGSQAQFRKVDHDYIVNYAKAAKSSGVDYFHLVSALGANKDSSIFYNKVKGETEEDVKKIGFETTFIYQPSLLVSKRKEKRLAEKMGMVIMKFINPIMVGPLKKYRSIHVSVVADGMYARLDHDEEGVHHIESDNI